MVAVTYVSSGGLAVTTMASGGLPVESVTSGGIAVTETANYGLGITLGQGGVGAPVSTLGIIAANRTQVPTQNSTTLTYPHTFRRPHYAHPAGDVSNLQFIDVGWLINTSEQNAGGDYVIKKFLEYPAGVFTPVTYSGVATGVTVTAGGQVVSDKVTGVTIPAGAMFWERTVVLSGADVPLIELPTAATILGSGDGNVAGSDLGNSGTVPASAAANCVGSAAIIGDVAATKALSFIVIGDSIAWGQGDISSVGAKGGSGWIARGLGSRYSHTKIAKPGQASYQAAASTTRLAAFLAVMKFSHAIFEHVGNDVRLGRTRAQFAASQQILYGLVDGKAQVFQTTMIPRATSSTDGYTTVAGQSAATDGTSVDYPLFNSDIRSLPYAVEGYIDVADWVAPTRDQVAWRTPPVPTTDGSHPNSYFADVLGLQLQAMSFSAAVAPSAVVSLASGTPTSSSIPVTFSAPATGTKPVKYRIEYKLSSAGAWTVSEAARTTPSTTISGLTGASTYDVRVTPWNLAGDGPSSLLTGIVTSAAPAIWTPNQLATLVSAFDTNDTTKVTADGSNIITAFGDIYGAGSLVAVGSPTLVASSGADGTKRVASFVAAAQYLRGDGFAAMLAAMNGSTGTTKVTVIQAMRFLSGTSRGLLWGKPGSGTQSFGIRQTSSNRGPSVVEVNSAAAITAFQAVVDTSWHVFTIIKDGTSLKFRVDRVEVATGTLLGNGTFAHQDLYFGCVPGTTTVGTPSSIQTAPGLSAILVAADALTGTALNEAEKWAGKTAGLTLA